MSKFDSFVNGGKRVRTADLCNAIAALYQLSYTPLSCVSEHILIIGALSRLLGIALRQLLQICQPDKTHPL